MHTIFYNFKTALYSSAIVMKVLIVVESTMQFYCEAEGWPSLNVSLHICPLTFINEALRLSDNPFVASTTSP